MLVFVDESGDPGRKTDQGSSRYFVVTTVLFKDREVATECDSAIANLRVRLQLSSRKEFHFNRDNDWIRREFLQTVTHFDFLYGAVVLNKDQLHGPGFDFKESLYKYTVRLAFSNVLDHLENATVVFDRCGGREFVHQLRNYLRKRIHEQSGGQGQHHLKKVRAEKSHNNNLLQMADMVCGAIARSYSSHRRGRSIFRSIIKPKELRVQVWPRLT